jgi:hypothetical protein
MYNLSHSEFPKYNKYILIKNFLKKEFLFLHFPGVGEMKGKGSESRSQYVWPGFLFFLSVLELELKAYILSHSQAFFCDFFFSESCELFAQGCLRTMILLISASWIVRITGVSHQHQLVCLLSFFLLPFFLPSFQCWRSTQYLFILFPLQSCLWTHYLSL